MKAEAKANESTDKIAREKVEKMNQADSLVFQTEKQLKEFGDKIPTDKKAPIETALSKLKEAHRSGDAVAVDSAMTEMNNAWTAASEEIYKAQASGGGQPNGSSDNDSSANKGETVTDAEFEEVK